MLQKLLKKITESAIVVKTLQLSKRLVLPGFDGLPIYYVAVFFINGVKKGLIATKASSMAFKFFLAVFPTIIFLFTLIPFVPIENFQPKLLATLQEVLPASTYDLAEETILGIVIKSNEGLLSFGFLFAIYFATNGINGMLTAFKDSINTTFKRNALKQRGISILLLFILTLLLIISIAAIVIAEVTIATFFEQGDFSVILISLGEWLVIAALCFFAISFIYYLGGNRKTKWRFFSAGSSLATFLVITVSLGFAFYVDNFGNYNKFYGSVGTLIVIMLWMYFNSFVLLIGFELNASIQQAGSIQEVENQLENTNKELTDQPS